MASNQKVLFCVLNWGLGHATRSTPIIRSMLAKGHEVHIASDGEALEVLKSEFPGCSFHQLPPYNIKYGKKNNLWFMMLVKGPAIFTSILKENKVVNQLVKAHNFDRIISDNRLGCYNSWCRNVYITHQLKILGGLGGKVLTFFHRNYMLKFQEIWIPDTRKHTLSGKLSMWRTKKIHKRYLGFLSRLTVPATLPEKDIDILLLLSGPEPQRSVFENLLVNGLKDFDKKVVLVRGSKKPLETNFPNREIYDLADAGQISNLLARSKVVVCRSGYSTLMDIYPFNVSPLLIPTPGQTEQEYLANRLRKKYAVTVMRQSKLKRVNWKTVIASPWITKPIVNEEVF
ncbi:MAG: glycosyltransferase [Cryomorphaceae bacterium]|nr:glycosyltransferase [Cryomorphaceae bacterium]